MGAKRECLGKDQKLKRRLPALLVVSQTAPRMIDRELEFLRAADADN